MFSQASVILLTGGACVVLFGGCVWFYLGVCVVLFGGMCGFIWGGVRGFIRGHAWFYWGCACFYLGGGCAWFFWGCVCGFIWGGMHGFIWGGMHGFIWGGGVRGFFSFFGYSEIRSMSGQYASYWNAFLLNNFLKIIISHSNQIHTKCSFITR